MTLHFDPRNSTDSCVVFAQVPSHDFRKSPFKLCNYGRLPLAGCGDGRVMKCAPAKEVVSFAAVMRITAGVTCPAADVTAIR